MGVERRILIKNDAKITYIIIGSKVILCKVIGPLEKSPLSSLVPRKITSISLVLSIKKVYVMQVLCHLCKFSISQIGLLLQV